MARARRMLDLPRQPALVAAGAHQRAPHRMADVPGRAHERQDALVERVGLSGLTMAAIAREAGIATGTLYVYHRSKEELLNALYEQVKGALVGLIDVDIDAATPFRMRFQMNWTRLLRHRLAHGERGYGPRADLGLLVADVVADAFELELVERVGHGIDQRLLALEMPVQRRRTDPQRAGDLTQGEALQAGLVEYPEGRPDDLFAGNRLAQNDST